MVALNPADNASVLLLVGADDPDRISTSGSTVAVTGATDLHKLLGPGVNPPRLHVRPNMLRGARQPEIGHYRCFLNLVTEAEDNDRVLETMKKLLRGVRGKVINPPQAVARTTRDQVAKLLGGIDGLVTPRVLRLRATKAGAARVAIDRAGLAYPLIVRRAGTHTGLVEGVFADGDDIDKRLPPGDYLAIEFVDFRSDDGLYRKYRVYFFGTRRIFRHLLVVDDWNIHTKDRRTLMPTRPDLIAEEIALYETPEGSFSDQASKVLDEIRARMPLDYFGIDFGILPDGRLVLFEANATMNFFPLWHDPQFRYAEVCLLPAHRAFREMLGLAPLPKFAE